jgi:Reverse transcriptase-like
VEDRTGQANMLMKSGDVLIQYALHTEVGALSMAVQAIKDINLNHVVIFSDYKQLSDAINAEDPPTNFDWRLYSQGFHIGLFVFMGREHNSDAHYLANWVRIRKYQLSGWLHISLPCTLKMNSVL